MEFTPEQIAALLGALGLPADTDDADLVVATAVDLAAQAAGMDTAKPSTVAAAARQHGMDLIDHDTHEALKRDAAAGRRIAASAARAKVEAVVDDAISTGRIMARSKKHWVTLCENDDTMVQHLASIAPGTAVPLDEVGHSADTTGELAEPAPWFYA
ncbi:phage protease [Mycolicibacter hiberniae]|uniref:Uncharacterized protein n=1 Tax=Mycolicibacter hiberniae TaxID=29314 RepID=A0A7I7X0V1_9MYCO|nr:phage protease [Mycolicibacter hiberniae]MCV7084380.1 hypothetical protein [Mycolicibacter hiberniae]ORV67187.1 hypothetical protein AWC09_18515 [Mycolicibacter hiberniae]BBZ22910.1 hypothetical protein MHIB_13280 [Mycolicibacter hiberniae]